MTDEDWPPPERRFPANMRISNWSPQDEHEEWIEKVVEGSSRLLKVLVPWLPGKPPLHLVAMQFNEGIFAVHLEDTMCSECGSRNGPCAVAFFGFSKTSYYLQALGPTPLFLCFTCRKIIRRRILLWRARDEDDPDVWKG